MGGDDVKGYEDKFQVALENAFAPIKSLVHLNVRNHYAQIKTR